MGAAAIIPALIAAGTTMYTSSEQSRQARLGRNEQRNILDAQKKELADRETQELEMTKRDEEKAKRQAKAASAGGRQSTILTSPLGVVEGAPTAQKTVLGA